MMPMEKTIIIAEAGVNHNGSFDLAKKLVESAANSGADYVKFQTFKTELNISKIAKKAKYQIANTNDKVETQFEMLRSGLVELIATRCIHMSGIKQTALFFLSQ